MKIFFNGTPRGDLDHCRLIYRSIQDLGNEHVSDFMPNVDSKTFYLADQPEMGRRYAKRLREISESDICVFEVSTPSLGVGQFLQGAEGIENRVQW